MFAPPPPYLYTAALAPRMLAFGDKTFGRSLGLAEVMRVGPQWIGAHIRRDTRERAPSAVRRHTEKAAACKPGGELTPEPDQTGPLISHFRSPGREEVTFCGSAPGCGLLPRQPERTETARLHAALECRGVEGHWVPVWSGSRSGQGFLLRSKDTEKALLGFRCPWWRASLLPF